MLSALVLLTSEMLLRTLRGNFFVGILEIAPRPLIVSARRPLSCLHFFLSPHFSPRKSSALANYLASYLLQHLAMTHPFLSL
jgi:hypothetical protein